VILSLTSAVGFCAMAVLIREAASFDTFMVAQFRFVIGLALLSTAALFGRIRLDFGNGGLLFLRGLTGGVSVVLFFIFFAQCLVGLWLVLIPANVSGETLGYKGGSLLIAIGVLAAVSQLLMTEGYRHLSVTTASLLGMLTPVLSFVVGLLVFREPMSGRAIVGALIVLGSCTLVIITDRSVAGERAVRGVEQGER
jgi:drug/metabolite transporter (DMT)-like permease